jgi:hypothetical protein
VLRNPARPAVRFPFRAHICGLVPSSDVYWLDDQFQGVRSGVEGAHDRR